MCVIIVACNLGVIEALYQMSRRSENRRLTRYPSELVAAAGPECQQQQPLREQKNKRLQESFSLRHSEVADDNSYNYNSSSFSRHHLSVRQKDSSSSSSSNRHHHHHRHAPMNQTQEEIKFARLMAVLCIFYVLCWIPQLVRNQTLLW